MSDVHYDKIIVLKLLFKKLIGNCIVFKMFTLLK